MRVSRLDGIRGIAIIMVFAHHVVHFTPGWVGVDLFFVLSGYLITTILRRDRFNTAYWGPFYMKRAARILPPLVVCFVLAALLTTFPWKQLGLYYVLFAANIAEARSPLQGDKELTILWSLAVEEHFYLFWPFAVRFLSRRTLIGVLAAVLCIEPVLRGLFTPHIGWWPMYILTVFRLDGLCAGSLLAILLEEPKWHERLARIAGPIAATVLAAFVLCSLKRSFWYQADSYSFNILGYSMIAAIATFTIAYVLLNEEAPLSRFLASRALVFIGLISYGAYLYHVMVVRGMQLFLLQIGFNHMRTVSPFTAAITIALAWVSYRFYEQPFIGLAHRAVQRTRAAEGARAQEWKRGADVAETAPSVTGGRQPAELSRGSFDGEQSGQEEVAHGR